MIHFNAYTIDPFPIQITVSRSITFQFVDHPAAITIEHIVVSIFFFSFSMFNNRQNSSRSPIFQDIYCSNKFQYRNLPLCEFFDLTSWTDIFQSFKYVTPPQFQPIHNLLRLILASVYLPFLENPSRFHSFICCRLRLSFWTIYSHYQHRRLFQQLPTRTL